MASKSWQWRDFFEATAVWRPKGKLPADHYEALVESQLRCPFGQVVANPNVDAVLVLACFLAVVVFRSCGSGLRRGCGWQELTIFPGSQLSRSKPCCSIDCQPSRQPHGPLLGQLAGSRTHLVPLLRLPRGLMAGQEFQQLRLGLEFSETEP